MKYIDLNKFLKNIIVFSSKELKLLDNKYNKYKTNSWVKKWYIKNIRKWYYILADININEDILFLIANKSYYPSYISLEMAFSYYNLIPEIVYNITSITSKKTFEFNFQNSNFTYRKINSNLFFWYKTIQIWKNIVLMAEIEKALLDYLYFNKNIKTIEDLEWLRLNKIELKKKINIQKLKKYSNFINKKFLIKKTTLLIKYIKW